MMHLKVVLACVVVTGTACSAAPRTPCTDGATQSLVCGLNGGGFMVRRCEMGVWAGPGDCHDPDECANGATDPLACGFNGRGTQARLCATGAWTAQGVCRDPDECSDGALDELACGLNRRGRQARPCVLGRWGQAALCSDPDVCVDGDVEHATCDGAGTQARHCVGGQWEAFGDCVDAPVAIIAAPGRRDMVHDARRRRVYITTSSSAGAVLSYDLATQQFDPPLLSGGEFHGIDLSPDGDHLAVADASFEPVTGGNLAWVHLIDLTTGTSRRIIFNTQSNSETSVFTTVFTSNTELLITTNSSVSGGTSIRRIDISSNAVETIRSLHARSAMLTLSANGSAVGWAEQNSSIGPCGRFDLAQQRFTTRGVGRPVYEIAVDRTAAQFAIPVLAGLAIFDADLHPQTTLGTADVRPVGAVYSPVASEIYLAWSGASTSISAHSSTSFQKLRDIELVPGLFLPRDFFFEAFVDARMKVSRDGQLLLVTMGDSVVVYRTGL
jgi:hypothetical protein